MVRPNLASQLRLLAEAAKASVRANVSSNRHQDSAPGSRLFIVCRRDKGLWNALDGF